MNDAQAQSLTSSDALVWADIENPPQVQYLLPILGRCRERGALTFVTARDYGDTFEMLRERGEPFEEVGQAYGVSRGAKALGLARRSGTLVSRLRATETPSALICASRAAVLAARMVGIPSFVIEDYEHSNTTAYRLGLRRCYTPT